MFYVGQRVSTRNGMFGTIDEVIDGDTLIVLWDDIDGPVEDEIPSSLVFTLN